MKSLIWLLSCSVLLIFEVRSRGALLRLAVREIVRLFILLDLACASLVQKMIRPKFYVRGQCDKRGTCCKHIVGDPPRWVKRTRLLQAFAAYHRVMHNFEVVARGPDEQLIFSCGHLRSDGRCGIYRYRPRICRNYPVLPFYGPPRLLPGCGYRVVPAAVATMRSRPTLPIVNETPAVHHPTPPPRAPGECELPEDYHWVEIE